MSTRRHPPDCRHCEVVRKGVRPKVDARVRFDSKVVRAPGGCLLWFGARDSGGYGWFWDGARYVAVHRWVYEQAHGPIADGLVVMHSCDTRACVEEQHLSVGTYRDNLVDASRKGRLNRGDGRPRDLAGRWL